MSQTNPEPAGKEESKKSSMKTKVKKKSRGERSIKSSDISNAKEADLSLVVTDSSLVAQTNKYQSLNDYFTAREWTANKPPLMTHNIWKRLIEKFFLHNAEELGRLSPSIPWQCYEPKFNSQLRLRMNIATHRIIHMIKKMMMKC